LYEAITNFGFGVAMLDLLGHVAAVVSDFYQKLGHVLI